MNNPDEVILPTRPNNNSGYKTWIVNKLLPGIALLLTVQAITLGTLAVRTNQKLIDLEIYLKEDITELKNNIKMKANSASLYRECEKINLQEDLREQKTRAWVLYRIELEDK